MNQLKEKKRHGTGKRTKQEQGRTSISDRTLDDVVVPNLVEDALLAVHIDLARAAKTLLEGRGDLGEGVRLVEGRVDAGGSEEVVRWQSLVEFHGSPEVVDSLKQLGQVKVGHQNGSDRLPHGWTQGRLTSSWGVYCQVDCKKVASVILFRRCEGR